MSIINITISFDEEKLKALDFTLSKDNTTAQKRVEKMLLDLYENTVPEALREYVDSRSTPPAPKSKRPSRPAVKKAATEPKPSFPVVAPVKEVEQNG